MRQAAWPWGARATIIRYRGRVGRCPVAMGESHAAAHLVRRTGVAVRTGGRRADGSVLDASATAGSGRTIAQQPERRTALVIGNGAYRSAPLINPSMMRAWSHQPGRGELPGDSHRECKPGADAQGNQRFRRRDRERRVGVFYFAGHGVQLAVRTIWCLWMRESIAKSRSAHGR